MARSRRLGVALDVAAVACVAAPRLAVRRRVAPALGRARLVRRPWRRGLARRLRVDGRQRRRLADLLGRRHARPAPCRRAGRSRWSRRARRPEAVGDHRLRVVLLRHRDRAHRDRVVRRSTTIDEGAVRPALHRGGRHHHHLPQRVDQQPHVDELARPELRGSRWGTRPSAAPCRWSDRPGCRPPAACRVSTTVRLSAPIASTGSGPSRHAPC